MKRILTILIILIASVMWGQELKIDTIKYDGKILLSGNIEFYGTTIPERMKPARYIFGTEYKKALDSYLLDLLKEYKAKCDKEVHEYEDSIFKEQNGISLEEYYANSKLNCMSVLLNQKQINCRDSRKPTFEGFIYWLERRVKCK